MYHYETAYSLSRKWFPPTVIQHRRCDAGKPTPAAELYVTDDVTFCWNWRQSDATPVAERRTVFETVTAMGRWIESSTALLLLLLLLCSSICRTDGKFTSLRPDICRNQRSYFNHSWRKKTSFLKPKNKFLGLNKFL